MNLEDAVMNLEDPGRYSCAVRWIAHRIPDRRPNWEQWPPPPNHLGPSRPCKAPEQDDLATILPH